MKAARIHQSGSPDSKQHQTIPVEPLEAPAKNPQPEIRQPADPQQPQTPPEAPDREPVEVPQHNDTNQRTLNSYKHIK